MKALFVWVGVLCLTILDSQATTDGTRFQAIDAERVNRAVVMKLPDGVRRVRVRFLNEEGVWETCTIAHLNGSEGHLKLRLPDGVEKKDIEVAASWSDPFPFEFYQGDSDFDPTQSDGGGLRSNVPGQEDDGQLSADEGVEESDIWKWRGSTLYFYNQYRGLQVVDVSDPSSPSRLASMRIPFSGEQLYLHPTDDFVVLLTYDGNEGNGQVLLVEHTESGELAQRSALPVPGYILESRMVGNILYVVSRQWWEERIVDPDTNVEHISWQSGLAVSKMDLTDPENPIVDEPLELKSGEYDYWGAQVQATSEALLVSTNTYDSVRRQSTSTVHVIDISDPQVAPFVSRQVGINGQVLNKFNMRLKENILTVVSQVWRWGENRQQYASVETFDLSVPLGDLIEPLARLEFANNESITASRFAGDLLYVVTVLRIDPLFVINLADPASPQLVGELEVPGFSTHLETMREDALISVGVEGSQIAVSWFDVSNSSDPVLASRVFVGAEDGWSWSEANWDEKAFGFFPEDGLILLPYQGSVPEIGWTSGVQIIEIGDGELVKRGSIAHEFQARRARVLNDAVVSISGRALKTLDITDPDNPVLLADLTLAWPADYVYRVGDYLVQLERGPGYWYGQSSEQFARLHVSPVDDSDERVVSVDLPAGRLVGSLLIDDCLAVALSQTESVQKVEGVDGPKEIFTTALVDLENPANPVILGSDSNSRTSENEYYGFGSEYQGEQFQDELLVWYPAEQNLYYYLDTGIRGGDAIYPYYPSSGRAYTVDISDKDQPQILSCVKLLDNDLVDGKLDNFWPEGKTQLLGSTLYFGLQTSELVEREELPSRWMARHWIGQLDLTDPAKPQHRDLVEIPGTFENATGNDIDGKFLFTSTYESYFENERWQTEFRIQALAFDGLEAFLIDELGEVDQAFGPRLFVDQYIVLGETDYSGDKPNTELTTYEWLDSGTFLQHQMQQYPGAIYRLGVVDDLLVAPGSGDIRFIDFRNPSDPARATLSFPNINFWQSIDLIDVFERESAYVPLGWNGVANLEFDGAFSNVETLGQFRILADESPEWVNVELDFLTLTSAGNENLLGVLNENERWLYTDSVEQYSYEEWLRHELELDAEVPLPLIDEDYDGDGLSNGLEYFTGSDPGDGLDASAIESWTTFDSEGSRYVNFRLDKNPSAAAGMSLVPQYSDDLGTWVNAPSLFETSSDLFSTSPVVKYLEPLGVRDKRFFRIVISSDN